MRHVIRIYGWPSTTILGCEGAFAACCLALLTDHDLPLQKLCARMIEADTRHTERMRQIVAAHGWPGTSLVGADGEHAAWLLVQHADDAPDFQELCLGLMNEANPGDVNVKNRAYLVDRVRVNTHRPQVYGTKFWTDDQGVFGPRPLENAETLDERRSSVGLRPFAEYRDQMLALNQKAELSRRDTQNP